MKYKARITEVIGESIDWTPSPGQFFTDSEGDLLMRLVTYAAVVVVSNNPGAIGTVYGMNLISGITPFVGNLEVR
jgi:hypothetical protein